MSFKMAPIDRLTVDCEIDVPVNAGEKKRTQRIRVTFKKHPRSVIKKRSQEWDDDNAPTDDKILEDDIIDIEGLMDADGNPIEYSKKLLKQLLEMDYVHAALMKSWTAVNYGDNVMRALQAKNG